MQDSKLKGKPQKDQNNEIIPDLYKAGDIAIQLHVVMLDF